MDEPVTFAGKMEFEDAWRAYVWQIRRAIRTNRLFLIGILVLFTPICYLMLAPQGFPPLLALLFPWVIGALSLLSFYLIGFRNPLLRSMVRRQFETNKQAREETTYTISDSGLSWSSESSSGSTAWDAFHRAFETDDDFMLQPQRNLTMLIPKRFLNEPQQSAKIRSLLKTHMGDRATVSD